MRIRRLLGSTVAIGLLASVSLAPVTIGAPTGGVTVTYAVPRTIQRLSPWNAGDPMHSAVMEHIFERLIRRDELGRLHPELATSWSSSENATVWTFKLRHGVRFTDGTPFNAFNLKATLEWGRDEKLPYASMRNLIRTATRIEVPDEFTIRFTLSAPMGHFPYRMAAQYAEVLSIAAIRKHGPDGLVNNPVGTGPFMLKEWTPGVQVVLVRNPNYWGEAPKIDTILFKEVIEDNARAIGLQTGAIDIAYEVEPSTGARLFREPNLVVRKARSYRSVFIVMNTQKPPFNDVRVRLAVNYAINRLAIVNGLLRGFAEVPTGPVAPTIYGYCPQSRFEYNPTRARQLLAEAGYPNGVDVPWWVPIGEVGAGVAEAVAAQLGTADIRAKIEFMEIPRFRSVRRVPVEQAPNRWLLMTFSSYAGVEDDILRAILVKDAWSPTFLNYSYYHNAKMEELLSQAEQTLDEAKAKTLYCEINKILWRESPLAWIYLKPQTVVYSARLQGVEIPANELINLRKAWVKP